MGGTVAVTSSSPGQVRPLRKSDLIFHQLYKQDDGTWCSFHRTPVRRSPLYGSPNALNGSADETTWMRAKAKNDVGQYSAYDVSDSNFKLDNQAPAGVTNLSASTDTVSSNEVLLSWLAPGDDGTTGAADHYEVRFTTYQYYDWATDYSTATAATKTKSANSSGFPETYTATGLTESVTYYFRVNGGLCRQHGGVVETALRRFPFYSVDNTSPAAITTLSALSGVSSKIILTGLRREQRVYRQYYGRSI